jgi:integrase
MKIHERSPGTWLLTWELGRDLVTGRRKQRTETIHGGQKVAEKRWRQVQREIDDGQRADPSRYTVGDLLDRCLRDVWPLLKPSTQLDYRRKADHYLRPALGHVRLARLSPDQIQAAYAALTQRSSRHPGQPLAPRTLHGVHAVLRAALTEAERWGWIARNPTRLVRLPTIPDANRILWTPEQWHAAWGAMQDRPWGIAVWLAATTAMRKGEILGLRWTDITWDPPSLLLQQGLVDLGKPHGGLILQPLKTRKSRRRIPIDSHTVAVLRRHAALQAQERIAAAWRYHDHGLVVQTALGTPYCPRNLLGRFQRVCATMGLPVIPFHDLRHLHASVLLDAGVPIKVVQERLGHARIQTTLDIYGHLLPGAAQSVTATVASWFGPPADQTGDKTGDIATDATPEPPAP